MTEKILAIQNAPGEHLGYFEHVLEDLGLIYEYAYPPRFPALRGFSRLIVLGGPMGVYEAGRYPFIQDETLYIRRAFSLGIPVLGICLGAQLMASSLGAEVFPGGKKELGWHSLRLTEEGEKDAVLGVLPREFNAFHWHGDTFTLPENTLHLASSRMYENQCFRYDTSYALQFHLEVTEEMIREWVCVLDAEDGEGILDHVEENTDALNDLAEKFLRAWLML